MERNPARADTTLLKPLANIPVYKLFTDTIHEEARENHALRGIPPQHRPRLLSTETIGKLIRARFTDCPWRSPVDPWVEYDVLTGTTLPGQDAQVPTGQISLPSHLISFQMDFNLTGPRWIVVAYSVDLKNSCKP